MGEKERTTREIRKKNPESIDKENAGIWKRKSFLTAGTTWLEDRKRQREESSGMKGKRNAGIKDFERAVSP